MLRLNPHPRPIILGIHRNTTRFALPRETFVGTGLALSVLKSKIATYFATTAIDDLELMCYIRIPKIVKGNRLYSE